MTIDIQVALWATGIVFVGGGMYADLRSRLGRMEHMLGNGEPGVFLRRDEARLQLQAIDDSLNDAHTRVRDLEQHRLDMLEGG